MWVSIVMTVIRNTTDIPKATYRLLDGLKLGSVFLLIVVNCCVACRAAMCDGYMKCLYSASLVPFDVHFQLGT